MASHLHTNNQGNYQVLVVGSQIDNLTLDFSFGHNLCFKCLNGSCEHILNIYISRDFQWYKELFNPMSFDLAIAFQKFGSPSGLQFPKWEPTWECVGSFPCTFLHSWECEMWLTGFTLSLHHCKPLLLVMSPRLRLRQL